MRGHKRKKSTPDSQQLHTHLKELRDDSSTLSTELFCVAIIPACGEIPVDRFSQILTDCNVKVVKDGNSRLVCGRAADIAAFEARMKTEQKEEEKEEKNEGKKSPVKRKKVIETPVIKKQNKEETLPRSSRRTRPRICYAAMASGQEYKIEECDIEDETEGIEGEKEETDEITNDESVRTDKDENFESQPEDENYPDESHAGEDVAIQAKSIQDVHEEKMILGLVEGAVKVQHSVFLCDQCGHSSKTAVALKSHKVYAHGKRALTCDVCFGRFNYQYQVDMHRKKHFDRAGRLTAVAKVICRTGMMKFGKTHKDLPSEIADQLSEEEEGEVKRESKFSCNSCDMVLPTKKALQLHWGNGCTLKQKSQLGIENSQLECPHCKFVCYRRQTFSRHMQSHDRPALFKCDMCEYTNVMRGEVNRHKRNAHSEKTIQCPQCTTKFRNQILLNQHIKQKHLKVYMRMCTFCGKEMQMSAYKEHYRNFHGPDSETERQSYVCQKCGRLCRNMRAFRAHMESSHTEENPEEDEISRSLIVNKDKEECSCRLCGFSAKYAKSVVRHIVQVHAERRHSCDTCGAAFAREKLLQRHVDIFHRKLEICTCEDCGRVFHSKQHLRGHIQRMHNTDDQHTCKVCGNTFDVLQALQQHMLLHKPEEEKNHPFTCDRCDKRFRVKSALTRHQEEHLETGEIQLVCVHCSEVFCSQSLLDQHKMIHTHPFHCFVCTKVFKLKKSMDKHIKTVHSDVVRLEDSMVVCSRCGEMFTSVEEIPNHECAQQSSATEEDKHAYICMACGVQFATTSEAEAHTCSVTVMPQQALVLEQLSDNLASQVDNMVTGVVVLEQSEEEMKSEEHKEESSEIFLCGICRQMFETADEINQHLLQHEQRGETAEQIMQLQDNHLHLQENPIQEVQLQDDITEVQLQDNDMTEVQLQDNEITEVQLQDNEITEVQLQDNDMTEVQLQDNDMTEVQLQDNEMEVQLQDNDMTEVQLQDNDITETQLQEDSGTIVDDSHMELHDSPPDEMLLPDAVHLEEPQ